MKPLTPTYHKSHAPAICLKQTNASLKALLCRKDMAYLIDNEDGPPQWAVAAPQNNSDADRFLTSLAITNWGLEDFLAVIKSKATSNAYRKPDPAFLAWLGAKPIKWHQQMYSLLQRELVANNFVSGLKDLQIVRLSNGDYSVGTKCFFPTDRVEHDDAFPRVARGVYQFGKNKDIHEKSRKFLELTGVREVGEAEEVEAMLRARYTVTNCNPSFDDLHRWVALVEKEPARASLFRQFVIFQREDNQWTKPDMVFLDKPFMDTGLSLYYNALNASSGTSAAAAPRALAASYERCGLAVPKLVTFAKAVGVQTKLSSIDDLNRILLYIEKCVASNTLDLAIIAFLWNCLCEQGEKDRHIFEEARRNHRGGGHYGTSYSPSILCIRLSALAWVPQKTTSGLTYLSPGDSSQEYLPSGFPFDSGWDWLKKLEFGVNVRRTSAESRRRVELAKELGVDSTFVEIIRASPIEDQEAAKKFLEKRATDRRRLQTEGTELVAFHEALAEAFARPARREGQESSPAGGASAEPKRRRERTGAEIAAALDAEPSPESRVYFGVCRKWKGKGDSVRVALLKWYGGTCQICGETFTQRNDAPYFEGVYLVPYTRAEWLDRVGNVVCVCALHSAMLQFGPLEESAPILDQILSLKAAAEGGIPEQSCLRLTLCGEQINLRYAEKHFIDLQEMIKASQKAAGTKQASE